MDPRRPNSREHRRQAIDAEIKSLEESLRVLKHRRNALAPISSLPTEVLDTIFLFARHGVTVSTSSATPGKKTDPLSWLRVSHVCHQWREIALNQPLFWNHVNFATLSSAGASKILARAKRALLYLEAKVFGNHWDDARYEVFEKKLQACISRTCHLYIRANLGDLLGTLECLVSPAPILETLSLSTKLFPHPPDFPETLFGGAAPKLSCLEIHNYGFTWKSPLLKGLRNLKICLSSKDNTMPSLSVWLDALHEMPQLTMLTLHEASPMASSFPFVVKRIVTLPSLTHLDIANSPRDCGFALAHLELPALSCLCLEPSFLTLDGDDVEEVLPYIVRHANTQPLQSMLIQGDNIRIKILAWPVPDIDGEVHEPHSSPTATPPAQVTLSIRNKNWIPFDRHPEFIGTVMAALPLDDLVTLVVRGFGSPQYQRFWHHNSFTWPLLRRVRLTSVEATRFTDWLLKDKGGDENPLLPSLEELVLVNAQLDGRRTRRLCRALMKRVKQGVPLRMLDLRSCSPDPANPGAVQLLSDIVVNVLCPEETRDARAQIRYI